MNTDGGFVSHNLQISEKLVNYVIKPLLDSWRRQQMER